MADIDWKSVAKIEFERVQIMRRRDADYEKTIRELRNNSGWISVEDSLPHEYTPVIVLANNGASTFPWQAMFDGKTWTFPYLRELKAHDYAKARLARVWTPYDGQLTVTHWMPYPVIKEAT